MTQTARARASDFDLDLLQFAVFRIMSTDSGVEELRHRHSGSSVESSGVTGKSWCVCMCVCELEIYFYNFHDFTASPKTTHKSF